MVALPERAPKTLLAGTCYDADAIRLDLARHNIQAVIPGRSNRRVKIDIDRALYKQRSRIAMAGGIVDCDRKMARARDFGR